MQRGCVHGVDAVFDHHHGVVARAGGAAGKKGGGAGEAAGGAGGGGGRGRGGGVGVPAMRVEGDDRRYRPVYSQVHSFSLCYRRTAPPTATCLMPKTTAVAGELLPR